jgi:hypothetical protein
MDRWLIVFYLYEIFKFNFTITGGDDITIVSHGQDEFVVKGKMNGK